MQGLVIRSTGAWYKVIATDTTNSESVDCRLRGNYRLRGNKQTNPVAVGDHVEYEIQDDGTGVIVDVSDRKNYIVRRATKLSKQTHVIAANIDLLCIVATLSLPRTSTGFIDRLLATAEAYHIPACLVMNKCDLYDDDLKSQHQQIYNIYTAAGYNVLQVSALKKEGLDTLCSLINGRTVLFSGHSGVGKSALINAICPQLNLRIGDISQWSLKGKHTTTFAEIFPEKIDDGGITYLIDTPGIKEFGMVDIKAQELSLLFPEMRDLLPHCRYANCSHTHEPDCAVKQAVEQGTLSEERYQNYVNILSDL